MSTLAEPRVESPFSLVFVPGGVHDEARLPAAASRARGRAHRPLRPVAGVASGSAIPARAPPPLHWLGGAAREERRVRRFAGAFVRRKRNALLLLLAAAGGGLFGLWLGYLLHQVMGAWLEGVWVTVGLGGAILVAAGSF